MRLLPLQIDMFMLAGEWLPFCEPDQLLLSDRLRGARQSLVEQTGRDFAYNLQQWHDYLVANEKDGYCWSNNHRSIAVRIRKAEANLQWREAVAILEKTT